MIPKNNNLTSISDAIKMYFKHKGFDIKIAQAKIRKNIYRIIPVELLPYILETFIIENKFYIKVNSGIVKYELSMQKDNMRTKINTIAGRPLIKEVIIF